MSKIDFRFCWGYTTKCHLLSAFWAEMAIAHLVRNLAFPPPGKILPIGPASRDVKMTAKHHRMTVRLVSRRKRWQYSTEEHVSSVSGLLTRNQALVNITAAQRARSISDFSRTAIREVVKANLNPASLGLETVLLMYV